MHTIQTFILRLLVDTDEPQALRGTVRSVTDDEKHSFTDGPSLLALLRRMTHSITGVTNSGAEFISEDQGGTE